jgi:cephalosporin hydroxylase
LIEDGVLDQLTGAATSAVSEFIDRFLQSRGDAYGISAKYCDRFGYNVTGNPNGWLKHLDWGKQFLDKPLKMPG